MLSIIFLILCIIITMIQHTFSLLDGIGERFERHLWRRGILTWDDFCSCDEILGINPLRKNSYDSQLMDLSNALLKGNSEFFASVMKRSEHWRLFEEFGDEAVCLDIETNGLHFKDGGYITLIGLYDGFDWKYLLRGENLTPQNLYRELSGYKYLITFSGTIFDMPFIANSFPNLKINIPHFDLCTASRKLGIKGGLKKIETLFDIPRDDSVRGFNGYDAVRLWRNFQKGSPEARELLLTYNMQDTINLLTLANIFYKMMRNHSGIDNYTGIRNV